MQSSNCIESILSQNEEIPADDGDLETGDLNKNKVQVQLILMSEASNDRS